MKQKLIDEIEDVTIHKDEFEYIKQLINEHWPTAEQSEAIELLKTVVGLSDKWIPHYHQSDALKAVVIKIKKYLAAMAKELKGGKE